MTDTTLKLTEAFNRHNSLYNALLGNLKTLTMNLKSLRYVTALLTCGRIAVEVADAQKRKPFHD